MKLRSISEISHIPSGTYECTVTEYYHEWGDVVFSDGNETVMMGTLTVD